MVSAFTDTHTQLLQDFPSIEWQDHRASITFGEWTFPVVLRPRDYKHSTVDIAALPIPLYGTRDQAWNEISVLAMRVGFAPIRVNHQKIVLSDVGTTKTYTLTYTDGKLANIEKVK